MKDYNNCIKDKKGSMITWRDKKASIISAQFLIEYEAPKEYDSKSI